MATTSARRNRAVWDRPATDTHLLLWLQPIPVFLGNPLDPLRKSIVASAPSRPPFPQRHRAADARVPSPRMITHGSYPQRACPTTVDARVLSRMISCSASLGVKADACGYASRMISRSALLGVEVDACGYASRMISRSALLGVEADACATPQMIPAPRSGPQRERWQTSSSSCPLSVILAFEPESTPSTLPFPPVGTTGQSP